MKRILSCIISVMFLFGVVSVSFSAFAKDQITPPKISSYCNLNCHPRIYWKAVKNANKYYIYRSNSKSGEYTLIGSTTDKSYRDKNTSYHKTYYYKVRAAKVKNDKKLLSQFSNIVKQKAKKTVLVGDSIMQGVREYNALPGGLFVTKIGVGPNSFYNYAYSQYKVNGKSTTGVKKTISTNADRIFIMLGMNEIDWNSTSNTIANYKKVLKKLKSEMKTTEIIVLATSPTAEKRKSGNPSLKKVKAYNKEVKKLCKELKLPYYDYTSVFKNSNGYLSSKYNGGDGCHWNKKGTQLFVNQLIKYTKSHP